MSRQSVARVLRMVAGAWLFVASAASAQQPKQQQQADSVDAPPPGAAGTTSPSTGDQKHAVDLFARASDAYRDGKFAVAISLLLELRSLKAEPVLHYNLARAYEGLGQWREAIASYEAYLREDKTIADRGAIERRLETLRRLETKPAPAAEPTGATATPTTPASAFVAPAIVGGVGVVTVGAGFLLGAASRNEESKIDDAPNQVAAGSARDKADSLATVANVAFVIGGVLVVTGAVWLLWPKSPQRTATVSAFRF